MNRAFYIVGICFSVFLIGAAGHYADEARSVGSPDPWEILFDLENFDSYEYTGPSRGDISFTASLWFLFYILAFIAIDIVGILKVKTQTMKVMGIIGLSLSGLILVQNVLMMANPSSISVDEVGGLFGFYGMIMLAFTIVGLVQSVRFYRRSVQGPSKPTTASVVVDDVPDLLD